MNQSIKLFVTIMSALVLCSCATKDKSILLGAGVGGVLGSVLGHQVGKGNPNGKVIGGATGAAVGGLIGYGGWRDKNKKSKKSLKQEKQDLEKQFAPLLKRPKVKMYWVPHQIKGKKFIERHRVWEIEASGSWSR